MIINNRLQRSKAIQQKLMGIKLQKPVSKIQRFLSDYTVIQSLPRFNITLIEQSIQIGKKQLLLKEYQFDTYTQAYDFSVVLQQKSHNYKRCSYLIQLEKYFISNNEETGKESISVFGLFNFPHRTLEHERLQRMMKGIRFSQNQIWSIAMSCVSALDFLEKNKIRHLNLSSSTITLDDEGVIRLYDPQLIKKCPNYSRLFEKKNCKNIYVCPELCQNMKEKKKHPSLDPYLSDVFVMGMIILEIGLMEYLNECYSQNYEVFDHSILEEMIQKFSQLFSQTLALIVKQMIKPIHLRPSFRRILYLIKKYQPAESKFSSYCEIEKPFQTPQRSRARESQRSSFEVEDIQQIIQHKTHGSQKLFEFPVIKGMVFANSDIKQIEGSNGKKENNKIFRKNV